MKNFLIRTWWVIIPILLIVVIISVPRCTTKQAEQVFTKAEKETALNSLRNELTTKYLSQNAETAKALQIAEKRISDGLKPIIIRQKADAAKKVAEARKDTSLTTKSDSAITSLERYSVTLERKVKSDSIQIVRCDEQNAIKDTIIVKNKQDFKEQLRINSDLSKAVKRNFFEKNGIPIGAGIAVAIFTALKLSTN